MLRSHCDMNSFGVFHIHIYSTELIKPIHVESNPGGMHPGANMHTQVLM